MRFAEPTLLFLLVVPLAAIVGLVLAALARQRSLRRVGEIATVRQQIVPASPYLRATRAIALVLGLVGLIIALSRPEYGGRIQMLRKRGIDLVVALDLSKSMLAEDVRPNRLERARLELGELTRRLTGDRLGLVVFAGDTMSFPLTTDYEAAMSFLKKLGPYDMPVGGTALGKAIVAGTRLLESARSGEKPGDTPMPERSRVLLLITDGEDHEGDPLAAAQKAKEAGIIIHTVGVGSDSPEFIPRLLEDGTPMGWQRDGSGQYVTTSLTATNEETLKKIANETAGRYHRAGRDLAGLAAFREEIRKLKQSEIQSRQITIYEEVFAWFLIPGAALLLLSFLLPERWPRRNRRSA